MTTTTQSASYSQMHFGGTNSSTNSNCSFVAQHQNSPTQPDSDCGSSSGVGGSGMTKHEGGCSSDASSLDSDSRDSGAGPPIKKHAVGGTPIPPPIVACPSGGNQNVPNFGPQKQWNPVSSNTLRAPLMSGHVRPLYTMTVSSSNGFDPTVISGNTTNRQPSGLLSTGSTTNVSNCNTVNGAPNGPINSQISNTSTNTNNSTHDVFVHVQIGQSISLLTENGVKQILGPATIRMVGSSANPHHPLPLTVPQGHLVQQILDEQGRLKHLILSSQPPQGPTPSGAPRMTLPPQIPRGSGSTTPLKNVPNSVASTSNGASPKSISPPVGTQFQNPLVGQEIVDPYYGNRQWTSSSKRSSSGFVPVACPPGVDPMYAMCAAQGIIPPIVQQVPISGYNPLAVPNNDEVDYEFEEEEHERERLKETLNSIQPPNIVNVFAREVEVSWQAIDTSEAAASGGPFPQIDASEFVYEVFVFEPNNPNAMVASHKCEQNTSVLRINRLKPNTNYMVNIRASLPDRDLYGYQSASITFKTKAIVPETPNQPKIGNRGPTWLIVNWRNSIPSGQAKTVIVQIAKNDKRDTYSTVFEGPGEQTKITNLEPSTSYKVRIIARNDVGDSEPSPPQYFSTTASNLPHHHQGPSSSQGQHFRIQPPGVVGSYNRSIKLVWTPIYNPNNYTLEYCDARSNDFQPVPHECYNSAGAVVTNLQSNREYLFRLHVLTDMGQEIRTEAVTGRTRRDQYENSSYQGSNQAAPSGNYYERDRVLAPINLQKIFVDERILELSWRYPAREFESLSYVLEGASIEENQQPAESMWKMCYKGAASSCTINDKNLNIFRVQAVNNRKHTFSTWSDTVYIKRSTKKKDISPPASCTTPKFLNITWCSMDVQWKITENYESVYPLIFELQRIDTQPIIIYSGEQSEYKLENLKPVEHVQVRARAVIVDVEGKRNEGDWSPIGSACTLYSTPSPPINLKIIKPEERKNPILFWDCPINLNGSEIIKYIINSKRKEKNDVIDEKLGESNKTEFEFEKLIPACRYMVTVIAVNKGGYSESSEILEFESPATVPDQPHQLHVEALSSTELSLSWTPGNDNGSPLTCHRLVVQKISSESKSKNLIAQHELPNDSNNFIISNLKPETLYKLDLTSENSEGSSEISTITCETFAPPPEPPELQLLQAQSNTLKLKWTNQPSSSTLDPCYYYLEKENDNGNFSRVFEGTAKFTKIKNLKESAIHRFRIRASHAKGVPSLTGPWSKIYDFMTTKIPPTTIKGAPTVTESGPNVFQIEWSPVRFINNNNDEETGETLVYRLQVGPKPDRKGAPEQWKTVYEGTCPSFTLQLTPNSSCSKMCRVFVVQKSETEELCSAPSLVTTFTTNRTPNESPKKRQKNSGSGSSTPSQSSLQDSPRSPSGLHRVHKMSLSRRFRKFVSYIKKTISERNGALLIMLFFFVFSVFIAVILNNYYQL